MKEEDLLQEAIRQGTNAGRFFTGQATGEEKSSLAEWRGASEKREALLEEIASPEALKASIAEYEALERRKAWPELKARLRVGERRMYRRAAAAVAAVALVGLGLYLWGSGGEEQGGEEIAPGGYRAILIVGDASPISIGEGARGALLADSSVVVENNLLIQATPREKGPDRVVVTPRGGEFPLALADGTRVWLNAETRLTFPAAFDDSTRAVTLSGEAYFEVARDEARPFIVKTSRSLVRVYGTSFNARAYPDDARQRITLERGSLGVRVGEREYLLRPGEQASTTANGETTVTLADARKQGVWREGKFAFERESLEEIMKQLARWYNVEVVFADRRAGQLHFSGELNRYNDLGRLLKMIELTTRIEFEIKERTIIVHAR